MTASLINRSTIFLERKKNIKEMKRKNGKSWIYLLFSKMETRKQICLCLKGNGANFMTKNYISKKKKK